jgi:hypothetical protein
MDDTWTCPHCGQTNRYPNHVANRYCSTCQHYCDRTGDDELAAAVAERNRLRDALAEVYFHLGPPQDRVAEHTEVLRLVQQAMADRDRLRQLVHDLWAAWNDDTIRLHHALMETDDGPPVLDLSPGQRTLLDETIRWAHGSAETTDE